MISSLTFQRAIRLKPPKLLEPFIFKPIRLVWRSNGSFTSFDHPTSSYLKVEFIIRTGVRRLAPSHHPDQAVTPFQLTRKESHILTYSPLYCSLNTVPAFVLFACVRPPDRLENIAHLERRSNQICLCVCSSFRLNSSAAPGECWFEVNRF